MKKGADPIVFRCPAWLSLPNYLIPIRNNRALGWQGDGSFWFLRFFRLEGAK
jgi:hypothetical protein